MRDALPSLRKGEVSRHHEFNNLDEFMMVRVGGLKLLKERNPTGRDPAGMIAAEQLDAVSERCLEIVAEQYKLFRHQVQPVLESAGIAHIDLENASESEWAAAKTRFHAEVFPVVSPQSVSHERFPLVRGLGVHLCVRLKVEPDSRLGVAVVPDVEEEAEKTEFALIPMARVLSRVMPLSSDKRHGYVLLENLVSHFVAEFFPGRTVLECVPFRVTRNADIEFREDEAGDLLGGMEEVLENRRVSRAVRLEYGCAASDATVEFLRGALDLHRGDVYAIDGPLDLRFLFELYGVEGFDHQRDEVWPPRPHPRVDPDESMFNTIAAGDMLLVHPYQSFDSVVRFIDEAADDPDVLAIKQVLYRTSKNSPVVAALERAAERGKYVTAIVELKARFDEARNIEWAREMERAGVQVIYGIHGLKTHAKVCIIVRREPQGIVRYMHFGTGNYNEVTAKLYGDVSLLTCDAGLGQDATAFFNAITGASQPLELRELAAAPTTLRTKLLDLINRETEHSLEGGCGQITAKLNALVDTQIIDALYRASRAGVQVRLNVRGQCCLRPGVPGLSESIEVVSIVDRFLEHARVFSFYQGGDETVLISSADWMPRNLDRRVELIVPVTDRECRNRLIEVLETYFRDNTSSWRMLPDGRYEPVEKQSGPTVRAQRVLYENVVEAWKNAQTSRRSEFRPLTGSGAAKR